MSGKIVRYSADEIRQKIAAGDDQTDYDSLMTMTDEEIDHAIANDPDWAEFKDIDWSTAEIVIPGEGRFLVSDIWKDMDTAPPTKKAISIRIDEDVLEFFRSKGKGWQTSINMVLRHYMRSQKK